MKDSVLDRPILITTLGPMRRRQSRRAMHKLHSVLNRMQDPHTETEEDGRQEGHRQVWLRCAEKY